MTQRESEVQVTDTPPPGLPAHADVRPVVRARPEAEAIDATEMLSRDHQAIRQLFGEFDELRLRPRVNELKAALVEKICLSLTIHAELEEQFFYPAVRGAIRRAALPYHAAVDHAEDRELIAMIDEMTPEHPDFDGAIAFLAAYVLPHMASEDSELFPLFRLTKIDTLALSRQMSKAQKALQEGAARARLARRHPPPRGWPPSMRTPDR